MGPKTPPPAEDKPARKLFSVPESVAPSRKDEIPSDLGGPHLLNARAAAEQIVFSRSLPPEGRRRNINEVRQLGLAELAERVRNALEDIDTRYPVFDRRDQAFFQLELGLRAVTDFALSGQDIETYVTKAVNKLDTIQASLGRVKESMKIVDGIDLMEKAFSGLLAKGSDEERVAWITHFISQHCPSAVFDTTFLRDLTLHAIEDTNWILILAAEEQGGSAETISQRLRNAFLEKGVGLVNPSPQEMINARTLAWADWPGFEEQTQ